MARSGTPHDGELPIQTHRGQESWHGCVLTPIFLFDSGHSEMPSSQAKVQLCSLQPSASPWVSRHRVLRYQCPPWGCATGVQLSASALFAPAKGFSALQCPWVSRFLLHEQDWSLELSAT